LQSLFSAFACFCTQGKNCNIKWIFLLVSLHELTFVFCRYACREYDFKQCVRKVAVHLLKVLEVMSTSIYTKP
jgi:hypothetical protein